MSQRDAKRVLHPWTSGKRLRQHTHTHTQACIQVMCCANSALPFQSVLKVDDVQVHTLLVEREAVSSCCWLHMTSAKCHSPHTSLIQLSIYLFLSIYNKLQEMHFSFRNKSNVILTCKLPSCSEFLHFWYKSRSSPLLLCQMGVSLRGDHRGFGGDLAVSLKSVLIFALCY